MADLSLRALEIRKDLETLRRAARLAGSDQQLDYMAAAIEEWEAGKWMEWPAAKAPKKRKVKEAG